MTVAALGVVGGAIGTFFPSGMDVPIHPLWKDLLGNGVKRQIAFHAFRNLVSGGLAAWATWILYTPVTDPAIGRAVTEFTMVGAIITGGTGAAVVSSLFAGPAKDRIIETMTDSSKDLLEAEIDRRLPPSTPSGSDEGTS
jgi:hypothetical protein